jgi:hypothetical protein
MTDRSHFEAVEIEVYGIEVTSGRYLSSYDIRAEPYDADRRFAVIDAVVTIDGRPGRRPWPLGSAAPTVPARLPRSTGIAMGASPASRSTPIRRRASPRRADRRSNPGPDLLVRRVAGPAARTDRSQDRLRCT